MHLKTFVILLVIVFNLANGQEEDSTSVCPPITINCICGTELNRTYVPLEVSAIADVTEPEQATCAPIVDPSEACSEISCYPSSNEPESSPGSKAFISTFYPIEISIPSGGLDGGDRFSRETRLCGIKGLDNADVKCWRWPKFVDCIINCTHGYAFRGEEGSMPSAAISCKYDEDMWYPNDFEDCKPYLNCKVKLVSGGDLKCKVPTDGPPYCDISCVDYEDYEPTGRKQYQCLDENFEKTLPHCARLVKDEDLLEKPNSNP